jgi:hypothetical protein
VLARAEKLINGDGNGDNNGHSNGRALQSFPSLFHFKRGVPETIITRVST